MTDPKPRDALAERLAEITNNYTIYSTDGSITVDYRAIASRLLESVPGEEKMARLLFQQWWDWPEKGSEDVTWDSLGKHMQEEFADRARFLRQHIAGWVE